MAGQWLCTNGCRRVDGGRTSLVTALISGCARGSFQRLRYYRRACRIHWQHHSPFSLDLKDEWKNRTRRRAGGHLNKGRTEDENPLSGWQQVSEILTWWLKAFVAVAPASHILEISQPGLKMASEVWNLINKCEANSSVSVYRNPDCLLVMISLSEQEEGHWQCDIVIFKSKLTPGATRCPSKFSDSKTVDDSLDRECDHTWLWLDGQWYNQVFQLPFQKRYL